MPGKSNSFANAVSRHPSPNGELSDGDVAEIALVGTNGKRASTCKPILWHEIITESKLDAELSQLSKTINFGFPSEMKNLNPLLSKYWKIRSVLTVSDGVIWYNNWVVLPSSLLQPGS